MGIRGKSEYAFSGPDKGEDVVTPKFAIALALATVLPGIADSPATALTQLEREQAALASERQTCVEAATARKRGGDSKLSALDYAEMHRAISACSVTLSTGRPWMLAVSSLRRCARLRRCCARASRVLPGTRK